MNILVTGAAGFVGRNLTEILKTIRDGKNCTRPALHIDEIYEYDIDSTLNELDEYCTKADFVFNLVGVNRPQNSEDYKKGNFGFASTLLNMLKKHGNTCSVMLSSSVQATLQGRFGVSEYGLSKREAENLFFAYAKETGAKVLVYRFPNLAGKWIRPNYNSAVATFCHNIANDLPVMVNDPNLELELLFIDDLVEEMLDALEGKEHHCEYNGVETVVTSDGKYCAVPIVHKATLGGIVEMLHIFHNQPHTLVMPEIPPGSFEKKLYSMYLSYLPKDKVAFALIAIQTNKSPRWAPAHRRPPPCPALTIIASFCLPDYLDCYKMNTDERGSFTEILKTICCGQFSVNVSKPGITKGQHWHNSKWELFIVVNGHGLIQERKVGTNEVIEFEVSGEQMKAVHMLPGYTHNIINLSDTETLVTLMWANEPFDPNHPDTFFERVVCD